MSLARTNSRHFSPLKNRSLLLRAAARFSSGTATRGRGTLRWRQAPYVQTRRKKRLRRGQCQKSGKRYDTVLWFSRESTRHADAGCRLLNRACNSSPLRVVHIVPPSAPTQTTALSNARAGLCSLHRFKDRLFCDFDRFLRVIGRILRISERNKMIENMVARDGVEPPTPAFSA